MYYAPSWFLKEFVEYLEAHPDRSDMRWGWVWSFALFASNALMFLAIGVLWSISSTHLQTRIKLQLYTLLFSKTLVKKDLASAPAAEKKITEESLSLQERTSLERETRVRIEKGRLRSGKPRTRNPRRKTSAPRRRS
jgi:hypothetical protein